MASLHRILIPGGAVHIATDHQPYFDQIEAVFGRYTAHFTRHNSWIPAPHERSDFELMFLATKTISRASYQRRPVTAAP